MNPFSTFLLDSLFLCIFPPSEPSSADSPGGDNEQKTIPSASRGAPAVSDPLTHAHGTIPGCKQSAGTFAAELNKGVEMKYINT